MTEPYVPPWDWCPDPVPDNVVFGPDCWLDTRYAFARSRTRRDPGVRVGRNTGIYSGSWFDLGPDAQVEIGSYCTIVGALASTNHRIVIGDYALISTRVSLVESAFSAPPVGWLDDEDYRRWQAHAGGGPIVLGDDVWIGAHATVIGPVTIGHGAIVGAACVVTGDIPDGAIVAGNPARIVGWADGAERERHALR